jgi:hypothetical protein
LDLLGFIHPNQDFSKGYTEKAKKFLSPFFLPAGLSRGAGSIRRVGKGITWILILGNEMFGFFVRPPGPADSDSARQKDPFSISRVAADACWQIGAGSFRERSRYRLAH